MKTVFLVCLVNYHEDNYSVQLAFSTKEKAEQYILEKKSYSDHKPWQDIYFIDEVELKDE